MILTAMFVLGHSIECGLRYDGDYESSSGEGMALILLLAVFMWFDLRMAGVMFG